MFDEMPKSNVVLWTKIIAWYGLVDDFIQVYGNIRGDDDNVETFQKLV